ncbi:MAG: hypothetical protein AAFN93_05955 [Bacteroidota bacterium]
MNKTIQRNRAMLERKTVFDTDNKRRYEKPLNSSDEYKEKELDDGLRREINIKLRQQRRRQIRLNLIIIVIAIITVGLGVYIVMNTPAENFAPNSYKRGLERHKIKPNPTIEGSLKNGLNMTIEYFPQGTKRSETKYKYGLKHQNSESYYESGEQFRSAAYFYDTLVVEVYFFKDGDTIKNFPKITDKAVHYLTFERKNPTRNVTFSFYDGKILPGSYCEVFSEK